MSSLSFGRSLSLHSASSLLVLVLGCAGTPSALFDSDGGSSFVANGGTSSAFAGGAGDVSVSSGGADVSGAGGASAGAENALGGRANAGAFGSGGGGGDVSPAQGGVSSVAGPCQAPNILDDAEDHDGAICHVDGHVGNWWTTNDGSGSQQQKPGSPVTPQRVSDRPGSDFAMQTSGSGFTAWGATLGFDVRTSNNWPYDASRFKALTFYAKGAMQGSIRVSIRVSWATPMMYGGTCVESSGSCYHYHGVELTLSDAWQQYRIPFADLTRENGWGGAFDPASVVGVEFRINNPACIKDFSLWIDDVAFELP